MEGNEPQHEFRSQIVNSNGLNRDNEPDLLRLILNAGAFQERRFGFSLGIV
jgi:hypothetical protein